MAKNLMSCCLLYLSVTLFVMNIGFIDAFQSGSQNKQSTDDATKAKLDLQEEMFKQQEEKFKQQEEKFKQQEGFKSSKNEEGNMFLKAAEWVSFGVSGIYAAKMFCDFGFFDGISIVGATKASVCPYLHLAKKSSD